MTQPVTLKQQREAFELLASPVAINAYKKAASLRNSEAEYLAAHAKAAIETMRWLEKNAALIKEFKRRQEGK